MTAGSTTTGTTRRAFRRRAALAVLCAAAGAAALQAQDQPRIPRLAPPAAIEARFLRALEGPLSTTITDVSFRTALGHDVGAARIEVVADPTSIGAGAIHARFIRIVAPRLISPVDTISTPFDPFIELPLPRMRVDRLVLEDGTFGTLAHPSQYEGRWLWLQQDVDVEARDIVLGGDGREGLRVVRASMRGELKGEAVSLTHAAATVARDGVLEFEASAGLGASEVAVAGTMARSGALRFDVATTPLSFAEAHAFASSLPAEGRAEIDATVAGGGDAPFRIVLRRALARIRESVVAANGTIRTGAGGAVEGFVVDVTRLVSADLDSVFGVALPGGGEWRGGVRADGPLETGVAIAGALERTEGVPLGTPVADGAGAPPRFVFDGTFRMAPEPMVALDVEAVRLPVRAGTAQANVRIAGPLDSLSVEGRVRSAGVVEDIEEIVADVRALILDPPGAAPRLVRATGDVVAIIDPSAGDGAGSVRARADGTAVLADGGALDARIVADSLPFALLPLPSSIDSVRGAMRADIAVTGTVDEPNVGGVLELRGGAFRVPAARLAVHDLAGPITIADGVADLGALGARANGGTIDVDGTVRLTGERAADVTIVGSDIALLADDSVTVLGSGTVRATGALAAPLVTAHARLTLPRPEGALPLATARGTVDLGRDGALDGELRADSLPLAALPRTDAVRNLRGAVRALVRIGGTLDAPTSDGRVELRGAGGTIVRTGTVLDGLRGDAVVRDGSIALDDVTGTVGGGALHVDGAARVANGPRTLSVHATIDRGTVVAMDSAVIVASADVHAEGALDHPAIAGTVTLHDGWVHEDNFTRRQPIDPAAPPYDELIERVPWLADSRLRQGAARPLATEAPQRPEPQVRAPAPAARVVESIESDGPRFSARIAVDIERPFMLIDEDSEIHGDGRITILSDSAGVRAEGLYRLTGGYYAQYGAIFEIKGGAFWFAGEGFVPRVTMRSEHRFEAPLGSWLTPGPRIMDRFPPLEFRALGNGEAATEEVRRLWLLPETRTELGALLLYDQPVDAVTGLETRRFWPPDDGAGLFGEAAATRGIVLLFNYIANESYDFLPLQRAYGRAGVIAIGPEWPGRITIGPYVQGGIRFGDLQTVVTQPAVGGTAPGIRLRYRLGAPELLAFSEPYFRSTPFGSRGSVFADRRRTGVGLRFGWEW